MRAFVLPAIGYLCQEADRVAPPGTRVVNSTAGGSSKDTLVLKDKEHATPFGLRLSARSLRALVSTLRLAPSLVSNAGPPWGLAFS